MAHSHDHHNGGHVHHHGDHPHTYSQDPSAHNARMQSDDAYREGAVAQVEHDLDYYQVRMMALMNVLREKGLLTTDEMRRAVEEIYGQSPAIGSRIIARAWVDEGFKERLLADADAACGEMGVDTTGINRVVALENTDTTRYMVVCTLCSCYPRQILGQPPTWYKSFPYRSKAVTDPRGTLKDMGFEAPDDVELIVIDSNADCRYLIIPQRPAGTEDWTEAQLFQLVTRDSMIGVGDPLTPEQLEEAVQASGQAG